MTEQQEDGPPLTFADLGIPTEDHVQTTILGKSRKPSDLERVEWIFLVVTGLGLPATLILTIYKLATTQTTSEDFVFALVLLVNTVFCIYYVVHGVLNERPYEVMVLVVATFIVVIYSILNYSLGKIRDDVKLARLILACIGGPLIIVLGVLISRQYYLSNNLIFRTVGANSALQDMCKLIYFAFGLLKFDFQLGVSMVILILSTSPQVDTKDIVVLTVGGVFSIAWFIIGYISARQEHKIGTIIFFVGSVLEPVYIIYKVVKSAQHHRSEVLATCTYVCAALAFFVRAVLLIAMVMVFRNYGKGLKEKVYGTVMSKRPDEAEVHSSEPVNIAGNETVTFEP